MVSEFDYDLEASEFLEYCRNRGVLHVAGEPGSKRWRFFRDFGIGKESFLEDSHFQFSESGEAYTADEMKTQWEIVMIGRAKLQDCWELFSRRVDL